MGGDWKALAEAVHGRRRQLRLPLDLSDRGGPGEMAVRRIEQTATRGIRDVTKTRLEHVLQWEPGLVDDILAGTATEEQVMGDRRGRPGHHEAASVVDVHRMLQDLPPLALASLAVARLSIEPRTDGNRAAMEALGTAITALTTS